jgi:poly-gamma-glutamate synthesis protein (capsule biosynthesis protein)
MRSFAVALIALLCPVASHARDRGDKLLGVRDGRQVQDRRDARDARARARRDEPRKAFDREERAELPACERGREDCHCPDAPGGPGTLEHGPRCFAAFQGSVTPLPPELRERMVGRSWREGCPVPLDGLALVTASHWDLQGRRREGRIVVAARVADDVRKVFQALYEARFPIARMETIDAFAGDDDASMAANNTSGFNCRYMKGSQRLSRHSEGAAIDLNPLMNPYLHDGKVDPPDGRRWVRRDPLPGVIVAEGPVVRAFESIGWKWGGRWVRTTDYQHFSPSGD